VGLALNVPTLHAAICVHQLRLCAGALKMQRITWRFALCACDRVTPHLQVVLSPQRPRTIISFENKIFSSDGPGSRPVLTMFPHTEGAKVSAQTMVALQAAASSIIVRTACARAGRWPLLVLLCLRCTCCLPSASYTPVYVACAPCWQVMRACPQYACAVCSVCACANTKQTPLYDIQLPCVLQVSKGLFTEYSLPNGRKAFMYYNSGSAMDEAEVRWGTLCG
jgi:hypothetical protein